MPASQLPAQVIDELAGPDGITVAGYGVFIRGRADDRESGHSIAVHAKGM